MKPLKVIFAAVSLCIVTGCGVAPRENDRVTVNGDTVSVCSSKGEGLVPFTFSSHKECEHFDFKAQTHHRSSEDYYSFFILWDETKKQESTPVSFSQLGSAQQQKAEKLRAHLPRS